MRNKLALIIALAGFAVVTALGVGMAGADPSTGLGDSARRQSARPRPPPPLRQPPACANEVDDDGDALVDLEDPDCESAADPTEEPEARRRRRTGRRARAEPAPAAKRPERLRPRRLRSRRTSRRRQRNQSLGARRTAAPAGRQRAAARPPATSPRRKAPTAACSSTGRRPDRRQPDDDLRALRPGADRRPQLRHRLVRDPSLPAADLPGLRHRVRHPLGGARLDQQNRDRVRHQPQRLQRGRDGLDAVPALELGRCTASTPTATAARTPTTRSTRSAPPPTTSRSPAAPATSTTRSSPTTTPTGTSRRSCSTPAPTASCRPTWSAR